MPSHQAVMAAALAPPVPSDHPGAGAQGPGSGFRGAPLLVSVVAVAATVGVLPIVPVMVGQAPSFLPAVLAAVACFDIISLYLLADDFLVTGDRRILATACSYLWSLVVMGGYALAFPDVFSANPPLATEASVAPYLYIGWHAGFPLLLGIAWAPWPERWSRSTPREKRRLHLTAVITAITLVSVAAVYVCVRYVASWPVLIVGTDYSAMTRITAPVALPMAALSLLLAWHGLRRRAGPERWAAVAVLVCLCDLVLTYAGGARYSVGWYAGRSLTMVAAATLMVAMLAAFSRLKAAAELNAALDSLTGLANRRSAYLALAGMVARARRSRTPLTVIELDLDHFKAVNDRFGHPAGDALLTEVGAALTASLRGGDVPARVGGEEFLVLLPDTDQEAAELVAERLRSVIADLDESPDGRYVRASLGVATLDPGDVDGADLLRRVDRALYVAKESGRNRVVTALPDAENVPTP